VTYLSGEQNALSTDEHAHSTAKETGKRQIRYRFVLQLPGESGISCSCEGGHMFICSHECAYCRLSIASGQRWVREKIYETTLSGDGPHYLRYHAELFAGAEVSCWEKHQMELEIARTTTRAA
jgi:hypothetical protein